MKKAELEAERDELLEAVQEARCVLDRALGVEADVEDDPGESQDESPDETEDESEEDDDFDEVEDFEDE